MKTPTLYLFGDPRIDNSVIAASVEVVLFEIITAGMLGQSIAINETLGDQTIIDRYCKNAEGAGMTVESLLHPKNS